MSSIALFSLIAAALVIAAFAFVLPTLVRGRAKRVDTSRAELNSGIYRQELDELEAEAARGEISADELQTGREQLHRRLMEANHERAPDAAPGLRPRTVTLVVVIALPLVAVLVYLVVGRPASLGEQALEPGKAVESEQTGAGGDYVARLQSHLERQPRDGRGWVLLARAQAERNEFKPAADAFQKAMTVSEKIAKDPGVLCEYADALGMEQGGRLAGRPLELIEQALKIDPKHPVALEMAGSAAYEQGRYAEAVRYWKELLSSLTPGSERYAELSGAVERAERKAAVSLPR